MLGLLRLAGMEGGATVREDVLPPWAPRPIPGKAASARAMGLAMISGTS